MANPFDALNQGLERLSTSPLGMAGLGLLMQPSQSLEPINPWEYAAKGMQMGIQNKRTQQEAMQRQQLLQQEEQRRRMQYLMDIQRYQQEQIKSRQAEQERLRQEEAMNAAIGNLTPEQQAMARAIGPSYLRDMARNAMKPPQQTNLERNLIVAGYKPGTPEFENAARAILTKPQIQFGAPEKPLSVSELSNLRGPSGEALPYGMTPAQAQQMGAIPRTPNDPIQQAEEIARRKQKLKEETASQGVPQALQGIYSARSQWSQNKTSPEAIARLNQERRRLAQILAAKRNPGRAPTDADVQIALQDIPDPFSLQQGLGAIMGEDPFAARMKVVEEELGAGKQGWQEVSPGVRIRRK